MIGSWNKYTSESYYLESFLHFLIIFSDLLVTEEPEAAGETEKLLQALSSSAAGAGLYCMPEWTHLS